MFHEIDLRQLADRNGPERAFLSVYLSGPEGFQSLDRRIRTVREMLADAPVEQEYFDENVRLVREKLETYRSDAAGLCLFACWATDYLEFLPLGKPVPELLWVDSSPYIRPLAELQDEYESFVVVAADNRAAQIYLVTSSVADQEARVRGDVKNQVKVGGWSQKRYARRRENELHHYAADVAERLAELNERAAFRRIILLGSEETMREIEAALPGPLAEKVAGREAVDLHDPDTLWRQAYGLFFEEERASEEALWEEIKGEYLRGGRAAAGPEDVLKAAAVGRVEAMIVTRDAKIAGTRCRSCENLTAGAHDRCPVCSSEDVFKEDLVNELVELLARTSARTEFADALPGLTGVGGVAALLRY